MSIQRRPRLLMSASFAMVSVVGVGCSPIDSKDDARIASLGMNTIISRVLGLGFDGFNEADSANITTQAAEGNVRGSVEVSGQVDQGASANKGMRLSVALADFADDTIDDPETDDDDAYQLAYSTAGDAPLAMELNLRDIPTGTLEGTVAGAVRVSGDLGADIDVDLAIAGALEDNGAGGTSQAAGTTAVTGTVESANGTFDVDFDI